LFSWAASPSLPADSLPLLFLPLPIRQSFRSLRAALPCACAYQFAGRFRFARTGWVWLALRGSALCWCGCAGGERVDAWTALFIWRHACAISSRSSRFWHQRSSRALISTLWALGEARVPTYVLRALLRLARGVASCRSVFFRRGTLRGGVRCTICSRYDLCAHFLASLCLSLHEPFCGLPCFAWHLFLLYTHINISPAYGTLAALTPSVFFVAPFCGSVRSPRLAEDGTWTEKAARH